MWRIVAFRLFGEHSRIPMLWVYSENDHFFAPTEAQRFKDAFTAGGGDVEFGRAPAFGDDGHFLFSARGMARWMPLVEVFLQRKSLVVRAQPLAPLAPPAIAPPRRTQRPGTHVIQRLSGKPAAPGIRHVAGRRLRLAIA
jgi:CubicO group peptidase (beta-lactamase class C family)